LLAAMIGVLLLDVMRVQMELMAEVTERNQWALTGNLALVAGVFFALLLDSQWGVWGVVFAAGLGEVFAILIMLVGLIACAPAILGVRFLALLAALFCAGWLGRLLSGFSNLECVFATSVTLASCAILLYLFQPLSSNELSAIKRMIVPQLGKAK